MKKHIFTATLLSCLACLATAANWETVGRLNKAVLYIDTTSIAKSPLGRKAWSLMDFDSPQPQMNNAASMMTLDYYDCQNRTSAIVRGIAYEGTSRSGEILDSWSKKQTEIDVRAVVPGSVRNARLDVVCSLPISTQ